ncbi:MAG: TetR/AcrR family transcriptional regulator [Acidimicrobiia bacterium]|nr:TetR/AcrR family transcriptional regulator [Acidimicrobiia bacterium]
MARKTGLRQRKKEQTRRRIEAVARELFTQHGFDGVTVDEIAAGADIAPRTFFHYFATKEDVALADFAARLADLVTELDNRPPDEPPWVALCGAFLAVASDYERQRDRLTSQFMIMAGSPSVQARSLQLQADCENALAVSLAQRRGEGPGETITTSLLAASAVGAMRSSLRHWLLAGHDVPLPSLLETCFRYLTHGLDDNAGSESQPMKPADEARRLRLDLLRKQPPGRSTG